MNKPPDKTRKALGRGLSALLPAKPSAPPVAEPEPKALDAGPVSTIPVALLDPNPLQPRTIFDAGRLQELANSILSNGIIQPLIVRRKGDRYELIAGERRLRAARIASLEEVPVIVQDYAEGRLLEVALIENIQREDLNPIETAQALDRLSREMSLSHEEIAQRTGKDRTTITNLIRLLRLPHEIQILLAERRLSMGHARAILGLATPELQMQVAEKTAAQGHSVRQVERLVQKMNEPREGTDKPLHEDPNVKAATGELESALGTRVRIVEKTDQRGRIEIEYYSQEDLNRLYEIMLAGAKTE